MLTESLSTTNYASVINDLRAKRDEIDRMIILLEAMSRVPSKDDESNSYVKVVPPQIDLPSPALNIGEACVGVLRARPFAMSNRQVTDALLASGYQINSREPVNNVGSALHHRSKTIGDVTRVGREWCLTERLKDNPPPHSQEPQVNGVASRH